MVFRMSIQCTEEQDEIMYLVKEYYGLMSAANTLAMSGAPSSMVDFNREQAGETWDTIKNRIEELVDCECDKRMQKPLMVRGPPVPLLPHEVVEEAMEDVEESRGIDLPDLPSLPKLKRGFWKAPSKNYRDYSFRWGQAPMLNSAIGKLGRKIHEECRGKSGAEFKSCRLRVTRDHEKKLSVLIAEAEAIFNE